MAKKIFCTFWVIIGLGVWSVTAVALAGGIVENGTNRQWEAKCVEAGVAEFVIVDPSTGRTEFRFKTPPIK